MAKAIDPAAGLIKMQKGDVRLMYILASSHCHTSSRGVVNVSMAKTLGPRTWTECGAERAPELRPRGLPL